MAAPALTNRFYFFDFIRAVVMQHRKTAISTVFNLVAFQNIDTALRHQLIDAPVPDIITDIVFLEKTLCIVVGVFEKINHRIQIFRWIGFIDGFGQYRTVMQIVTSIGCRRQGVGHFIAIEIARVFINGHQEIAARRLVERILRREMAFRRNDRSGHTIGRQGLG